MAACIPGKGFAQDALARVVLRGRRRSGAGTRWHLPGRSAEAGREEAWRAGTRARACAALALLQAQAAKRVRERGAGTCPPHSPLKMRERGMDQGRSGPAWQTGAEGNQCSGGGRKEGAAAKWGSGEVEQQRRCREGRRH
jgi:hypothetical protein